MKTFEFRATVTLEGVQLYVEAESEEEARKLCEAGKWTDEEIGSASWSDYHIGRLASVYDHD